MGAEYNANENRSFSRCLPETRVELLDNLCTSMQGTDRKVIWLFGEAGSGKSAVAYTVADRLRTSKRLAATFFFSRNHTDLNNTNLLYLTLAYQIGSLHFRAKQAIIHALREDPELLSDKKSRADQFERLIKEPLKTLRLVWQTKRILILDAADE
ncbi:hypothetical protein CONPUDRAFT_38307, partial [Coniophora puteana RWD-64-598 SS2]